MLANLLRTTAAYALLLLVLTPCARAAAEVIYDNTTTSLGHYAPEKREYGDQLDLEGTARTLTEIAFEYFGRFDPDGTQGMKVRVYTNEDTYDLYRKAPTRLLYESGFLPLNPGYNSRRISNLSVPLPRNTVTVTVQFYGLKTNEEAGLLLYSPPTVGFSFNEFWGRAPDGRWQSFLYSLSDPALKANASIRLTAIPEPVPDQKQTNWGGEFSLRSSRALYRAAQVFAPQTSGRLDRVNTLIYWSGPPVHVRIFDAPGFVPGTNLLAEALIDQASTGLVSAAFYEKAVYLQAGQPYSIEYSTDAGYTPDLNYTLRWATNSTDASGALWVRPESDGAWRRVTRGGDGITAVSAVFETWIVPGGPAVRVTAPRLGEKLSTRQPIRIRAALDLPPGKAPARVKFFANGTQLGESASAPYEFEWTDPAPGNHVLRVFAEDTLREVYRSDFIPVFVRSPDAPANDDFATRVALSGVLARAAAQTAGATLEPDEPRFSTNGAGATIWWAWTAPNDAPVTVTAQNSQGPAVVGIFTGSSLSSLALITNGQPSCIFRPVRGMQYAIAIDPLRRGDEVMLDIASADLAIASPEPNHRQAAPCQLNISTSGATSRQLTNVQFYANGKLLKELSAGPYTFEQDFSTSGIYDLTVAATDDRGVRTISAPVRVTLFPAGNTFENPVSVRRIIDGSISVVFDSPAQVPVLIEYTDDLATWKQSPDQVIGNGERMAWIDGGPPRTDSHPKFSPRRFYRLKFGF